MSDLNQNILFLDFDGVINDNTESITKSCLYLIKKIILKYKAKVVVISSWYQTNKSNRKEKITLFLHQLGIYDIDFINLDLQGNHPELFSRRTLGIIDYLIKYPNINYLILDDEFDSVYRLLGLNYLKTNMWSGFTIDDYKKVQFKPVDISKIPKIKIENKDLDKKGETIVLSLRKKEDNDDFYKTKY